MEINNCNKKVDPLNGNEAPIHISDSIPINDDVSTSTTYNIPTELNTSHLSPTIPISNQVTQPEHNYDESDKNKGEIPLNINIPVSETPVVFSQPIEQVHPQEVTEPVNEEPIHIQSNNNLDLSVIPQDNNPSPPIVSDVSKEESLEIDAFVGEEDELLKNSEIRNLAEEFGEYDPELDLPKYKKPNLSLLKDFGQSTIEVDRSELENNKNRIITTLKNYKIEISEISAVIGPTITLYEIVPAPGIRISKIKNLEDDIALSLSALGIRIIAPIPGRGTIGIEVPNKNRKLYQCEPCWLQINFKIQI